MVHGIAAYFAERARFARRTSLVTLAVGAAFLGMLWAGRAHPVRDALDRTARFGFEGPDQYVRRITLQQVRGTHSDLSDVGHVAPRAARGSADARASESRGRPATRPRLKGAGSPDAGLEARPTFRLPNVPVVQSEDLVIAHLVRPVYPPAALEEGLEGRVSVQALIDTAGRVVDVQLLTSSGQTQFERAASDAVWLCRFHPYRVGGTVSEVYAIFRFSFRIY
ncbi:MAG TPA: energy transducer TonB [Candidatus Limnocylindria bacterium]|nr:energy transducer TonB [Candidatus Limnocylindria bacterium]